MKYLCFFVGSCGKKDNEGYTVVLGVELTCFKETFRLKISTRHYVGTRRRN